MYTVITCSSFSWVFTVWGPSVLGTGTIKRQVTFSKSLEARAQVASGPVTIRRWVMGIFIRSCLSSSFC